MIECVAMAERMPEVVHQRDTWSDSERAHLAACSQCRAEWELVQAGFGLHADLALSDDRIAERVRVRLQEPSPPVRRELRLPWRGVAIGVLVAAASVVLMLAVPRLPAHKVLTVGAAHSDDSVQVAVAVLPELQGLDDAQLESVLQALGPTASDATPGVLPHLEDLTDSELEQLLHSEGGE